MVSYRKKKWFDPHINSFISPLDAASETTMAPASGPAKMASWSGSRRPREFGTIFFSDGDIYVGEYYTGKRFGVLKAKRARSCSLSFLLLFFFPFFFFLFLLLLLFLLSSKRLEHVDLVDPRYIPCSSARNQKIRDGWGVELRHFGERYEGEWCNGHREGLGILTCTNSQRACLGRQGPILSTSPRVIQEKAGFVLWIPERAV